MAFTTIKNKLNAIIGYLQSDSNDRLGTHNLLHVKDQKTAGTQGGTFTSGAWRTRDLNTVVLNNITGASLASNQLTLPAGTYFAEGMSCVCCSAITLTSMLRLMNITTALPIILGMSGGASVGSTGANGNSKDFISGHFTLAAQSVVELQHRCDNTMAGYGLGVSSQISEVNTYSDLKIWKIA